MLNFRGVWEIFSREVFTDKNFFELRLVFDRTLSGFFANSDEIRKCGAKKGAETTFACAVACVYFIIYRYLT